MSGDDTVAIVLDTLHDHRTGYLFQTNAAGARLDGLISDPNAERPRSTGTGSGTSRRGSRRPAGPRSSCFPAQTIRFEGRGRMGLQHPEIRRPGARHAALERNDAGREADRHAASRNPRRHRGLSQGWGLTVSPYALGAVPDRPHGPITTSRRARPAVDVGYHATSQLDAVLTINPDFAEVEADTRQVNLTRFDLFFPGEAAVLHRRRELFRLRPGSPRGQFIPFYSRRVGLFDGPDHSDHGGSEDRRPGGARGASAPSTCRPATATVCRRRTWRRDA